MFPRLGAGHADSRRRARNLTTDDYQSQEQRSSARRLGFARGSGPKEVWGHLTRYGGPGKGTPEINISDVVAGTAQIRGSVVQGRDFGTVNFGRES